MDEVKNTRRSPKPFFTVAAWLSLLVPLLAAGWVCIAGLAGLAQTDPDLLNQPKILDTKVDLVVLALVFGVSFVVGCVSLWGVRTNGALVILPPALLGILVSAGLEVTALIFLILSDLPTN